MHRQQLPQSIICQWQPSKPSRLSPTPSRPGVLDISYAWDISYAISYAWDISYAISYALDISYAISYALDISKADRMHVRTPHGRVSFGLERSRAAGRAGRAEDGGRRPGSYCCRRRSAAGEGHCCSWRIAGGRLDGQIPGQQSRMSFSQRKLLSHHRLGRRHAAGGWGLYIYSHSELSLGQRLGLCLDVRPGARPGSSVNPVLPLGLPRGDVLYLYLAERSSPTRRPSPLRAGGRAVRDNSRLVPLPGC
jgi:hypothetical protein